MWGSDDEPSMKTRCLRRAKDSKPGCTSDSSRGRIVVFTDFVMYYYPMGEVIFQTALPISGFLYSPFIAILLAVFPPRALRLPCFMGDPVDVLCHTLPSSFSMARSSRTEDPVALHCSRPLLLSPHAQPTGGSGQHLHDRRYSRHAPSQRSRLRYADLWSFQIVFLTIPFLLKTSWPHDFVFLPFTQALFVWWLRKGRTAASESDIALNRSEGSLLSRHHRFSRTRISVAFILLSVVLSNIVFFNIFGNFTSFGFCSFLFVANLLLLIALYVQLLAPLSCGINMMAAQPDSFNIFLT